MGKTTTLVVITSSEDIPVKGARMFTRCMVATDLIEVNVNDGDNNMISKNSSDR